MPALVSAMGKRYLQAPSALVEQHALREFAEEVGRPAPEVEYVELGAFRYSSGKVVTVFAGESDFDPDEVVSNLFEIEWPPRSGRLQSFPELDAAGWFAPEEARDRLVKGQRPALDALVRLVTGG